jgi:hypothetical protein
MSGSSWSHGLKNLLGVLKHHFRSKLSKELKKSYENFSGLWVSMVLGLLA